MEKSNLTVLNKKEPNKELIKGLKEIVELAEKGEIQSYAGVGTMYNNDIILVNGGKIDIYAIVGALEALKTEILLSYHEFDLYE